MKPCKQTLSLQLHLVHYRSMAVVDLTMLELGEKCCKTVAITWTVFGFILFSLRLAFRCKNKHECSA